MDDRTNYEKMIDILYALPEQTQVALLDEFADTDRKAFTYLMEDPDRITDENIEFFRKIIAKYGVPEEILDRQTILDSGWVVMSMLMRR